MAIDVLYGAQPWVIQVAIEVGYRGIPTLFSALLLESLNQVIDLEAAR